MLVLLVVPITLGTLFYTLVSAPQYEAFMTLADRRPQDINLPILYSDELARPVNDQEIRVLNLANTISSYSVLKAAYDELTGNGTIDKNKVGESEFINRVSVNPLRGTEYLQVSYTATKPLLARQVIDTILRKFMERYRSLNSNAAKQRTIFVEQQLKDAQAAYKAKLQEQKQFQDTNKAAIAYTYASQGLVTQMAQAKIRLAEAERNLAAAQGNYETASQQLNNLDVQKNVPTVQETPNPVWNELTTRLATDKAQLAGLQQRYGPKHPQILGLQQAVAEEEAKLKITPPTIKSVTNPPLSDVENQARLAKYNAQRQISASQQEKANAERSVREIQAKIFELPAVEAQLTGLQAELVANAEAVKNLTSKLGESQVRKALSEQPTIYMLDDPVWREVPRNTVLKTMLALFLSLIVAISLIASLGQVDQGTYTPMEAENSLGFPVIAVLPRSSQQRLSTGQEQATALAASYQILSTEIMSVKDRLVGPGILIAAAEPDSGRSTVAANLAISLARDGARVLLIDADMRSPSLHEHFGLDNRAGLSEVLQGGATVESVVQPTGVDGLLFIAAGQPPVNPVRLFRGEQMDQFIELVSKGADYIVFDSPAGSTFGDAAVLAANVQNVVLVHEAGSAPSVAEYEFHKSLERLGVNIIGMVLNKAMPDDCPAYQHFRKNYETTLGRYRPTISPSALGAGDKPVREKPQQYGARRDDEED